MEAEQNQVNGKVKTLTAYFGNLVNWANPDTVLMSDDEEHISYNGDDDETPTSMIGAKKRGRGEERDGGNDGASDAFYDCEESFE